VKTYILKRLLLIFPTLLGMTLLTYGIVRLAPGDPIEAMIRNQSNNIDPKAMRISADRIRERLGLNDYNFWGDAVEPHLAELAGEDPAVRARGAAELVRITRLDINQSYDAWNAWWSNRGKLAGDAESLVGDLKGDDEAARKEAQAKLQELAAKEFQTPEAWAAWLEGVKKEVADAERPVQRLRSIDEPVRAAAAGELRKLTGLDFTENEEAWQAWWAVNKYAFGKTLVDPAEKVINVFYGYGRWMSHLFRGDFGESIVFRMPKSSEVVRQLSRTQNWMWGVNVGEVETQLARLKGPVAKEHAGAAQALAELTDRDFGLDADAWNAWWTEGQEARWDKGLWAGMNDLRTNGSKNPFWIILDRIPVTFILNLLAEIIIFVVAVPVGLAAARHHGRWFDRGSSYVLLALWSIPVVLAGSLLLSFFAKGGIGAQWFPVGNLHAPGADRLDWGPYLSDLLWHSVLPVACLVYGGFAYLAKLGRASLLENLRADYVRTARAKGLPERRSSTITPSATASCR
jgi:ABC-type dipeptide/oligopeptide/nickel transport system permease component